MAMLNNQRVPTKKMLFSSSSGSSPPARHAQQQVDLRQVELSMDVWPMGLSENGVPSIPMFPIWMDINWGYTLW